MPEAPQPKYELDYSGATLARLKKLAATVTELGEAYRQPFAHALSVVCNKLMTDPLGWGEPEYPLYWPGLKLYHAMYRVIHVRYFVLQDKNVVVITELEPVPSFLPDKPADENP